MVVAQESTPERTEGTGLEELGFRRRVSKYRQDIPPSLRRDQKDIANVALGVGKDRRL